MQKGQATVAYKWKKWFKDDRFELKPGKDYLVSSDSMSQQIRTAARAYRKRVSISVDYDGIIRVKVGSLDAKAQA